MPCLDSEPLKLYSVCGIYQLSIQFFLFCFSYPGLFLLFTHDMISYQSSVCLFCLFDDLVVNVTQISIAKAF